MSMPTRNGFPKLDGSPDILVFCCLSKCVSATSTDPVLSMQECLGHMHSLNKGQKTVSSFQWAMTMASNHKPAGPDRKPVGFIFINFGVFYKIEPSGSVSLE